MQQQISEFQIKFPLSVKKKFWKKLITSVLGYYIFVIVFFGPFLIMMSTISKLALKATNGQIYAIGSFNAFFTFVLVFLLILITLLRAWYLKVYIARYYYSADQDFLTIKKGVFGPREIHVQYKKIQDVYVDQDVWDRVFELYDVHIASATITSGMEAHIDGVNQQTAEGLKEYLLNSIKSGYTSATSTPQSPPPQIPQTTNFSEEISSSKYPLANRWLISSIISSSIGSIFASAILSFFLVPFFLSTSGMNRVVQNYGNNASSISITFASSGKIFVIPLLIFTVLFVGNIIYFLLWRKKYKFEFNPEFIYYRTGVIAINEQHMPYNTVQNVNVQQSIIDRIFNLSNVIIENAAQGQIVYRARGRGAVPFNRGIIIKGISLSDANHIAEVLRNILLTKNPQNTGL